MSKMVGAQGENELRISLVEPNDERITGCGGLSSFVQYVAQINVIPRLFLPRFSRLRKNQKGVPTESLLKQILFFLLYIDVMVMGNEETIKTYKDFLSAQKYKGLCTVADSLGRLSCRFGLTRRDKAQKQHV